MRRRMIMIVFDLEMLQQLILSVRGCDTGTGCVERVGVAAGISARSSVAGTGMERGKWMVQVGESTQAVQIDLTRDVEVGVVDGISAILVAVHVAHAGGTHKGIAIRVEIHVALRCVAHIVHHILVVVHVHIAYVHRVRAAESIGSVGIVGKAIALGVIRRAKRIGARRSDSCRGWQVATIHVAAGMVHAGVVGDIRLRGCLCILMRLEVIHGEERGLEHVGKVLRCELSLAVEKVGRFNGTLMSLD
mmetsp:Transcript_39583/g.63327  ORF Transcript_39583/g.63327 Transcript_39583/m.63327 type:complete len:247 (-) Transcript_39583:24-764(-)